MSNNNLSILGVIPARYKSSRLEGKPLVKINGIPMIKRTYDRAKQCQLLTDLLVATDDDQIYDYCVDNGMRCVMTSSDCKTGTDRVAEVSQKTSYDLYINIQGDEPVIDPIAIEQITNEFLKYGEEYVAYNLYKIIDSDYAKSNTIIKSIVNEKDELLYMSRARIPFSQKMQEISFKQQIPVYGYTKKALDAFSRCETKTINEQHEDIEMLRFIDLGLKVKMLETNVDSIAVDVPDDITKVENFLNKNNLE